MGYDLHITRKEDWNDDEQTINSISLNEWLEYINTDAELELSTAYEVKAPGSNTESMVAPGFCEWISHPRKDRPWFDYYQGSISTKNPDEDTIRKMLTIAKTLNAKLQGDHGEVYKISASNKVVHQHASDNNFANKTSKKPWWKFW